MFQASLLAKKSQNITWSKTVDGNKVSHKRIRRLSMDKFYELVTGNADAFYKTCRVLPNIIEKVITTFDDICIPQDIVFKELETMVDEKKISMIMAIYMLGFSTYNSFE